MGLHDRLHRQNGSGERPRRRALDVLVGGQRRSRPSAGPPTRTRS